MKLLDSTFIIDYLKNDEGARKKIDKEQNETFFFTDLTVYEISLGIFRLDESKKTKALAIFMRFIQSLDYLPLITEASLKAAEIKISLIKRGITIDDFDCLIAASGIVNNIYTIITRNSKHFSSIDKIKVENY